MSDFWDDRPDHLTPQIEADFGTDGFYERYAKAQDLVTNRHSKAALVSLVTYLLKSEAKLAEAKEAPVDIISVGGCYGGAAHMQKVDEIARATLDDLNREPTAEERTTLAFLEALRRVIKTDGADE